MSADRSPEPDPALCDQCGAPLPRPWFGESKGRGNGSLYCCLGCRIAASVAGETGAEGEARWTLAKIGLSIFCTMNVMVFTMALWTYDVYDPAAHSARLAPALAELFRYAALVCATPVVLLLGPPLAQSAWQQLTRGMPGVDPLLLAGVVASYLYSVWAVIDSRPQIYFEVACVVLVAVTLGRWFEATARLSSGRALDGLERWLPRQVRRIREGAIELVALEELRGGEIYQVLAGERLAADGQVVRGGAYVDEQLVNGESVPTAKREGDLVYGGTLSLDGTLEVLASAAPSEGTLSKISEAIRAARLKQGRSQRLADRVASLFSLAVGLLAIAAFFYRGSVESWPAGLWAALAVLLIACPCALAVATPLAVWHALERAAQLQIVFRGGDALERLAEVDTVRLDKTGTLTTGSPRLVQTEFDSTCDESRAQDLAARMADESTHPLARALTHALRGAFPHGAHELLACRTVAGCGVEATLRRTSSPGETTVRLGSVEWLIASGDDLSWPLRELADEARLAGAPTLALSYDARVQAIHLFEEGLRPGAVQAIAWLAERGYAPEALSGDSAAAASHVAKRLTIPIHGGQSPQDKLEALESLARQGRRVAMVGDGVNDAPALAGAHVGVSLGSATDLARDTAGVCLLGGSLSRLPVAIELSKFTLRVVRQNLFWALVYNSIGIGLAIAGRLNPIVASAAMVASSAAVIANSLRIRSWEPPSGMLAAEEAQYGEELTESALSGQRVGA